MSIAADPAAADPAPQTRFPPTPGDFAELRDYAAIGDGRTVALIRSDGRVDWFPVPELDARPLFDAILDADDGGFTDLAPEEEFEVERRYVPGTNVLETTFTTVSGSVRVTDALVTGVAGRLPWTELARRVDGLDGAVRMRWCVRPGTRLGHASPWIEENEHGAVIRSGGVMLSVVGLDHGPAPDGGERIEGAFTTAEGSRHLIALVGTDGEPLHLPNPAIVDEGVDRTIRNWQHWSEEFRYEGPWQDQVQRSALALKLLIYSPSGAIAAAATTSLPEDARGGKNWDYRYAWVRDAAYTMRALVKFGLREETHAAISWLLKTIREHGPELHVFYGLDGGVPAEVEMHHVDGWRGIGPVVTGNGAQHQLQLGVFGDLFDIVRLYVSAGNMLDPETGRLLAGIADRTCDQWRSPDAGMWELPEERHHTSSKMGCWQALDAAVELAEAGHIPGSADRWKAERERIHDWVEEHGWNEEVGAYTMSPGSDELDASVLLHSVSGFDRGERMSRTIDALRRELGVGPHLLRYTGVGQEEPPFVACGFWMASALACVGRQDEAVALMDELVATTPNDVGIMAEMIDPVTGAFWGNLPQGLSHLGLVNAAVTIRELSGADE